MRQFLVFDSSCSQCSRVAKELERISSELTTRSLHDPEVRAMLDRAVPGWRPRPMLVSEDGNDLNVRAGVRMGIALARTIGVRRTLGLVRMLSDEPAAPSSSSGVSRRTVLGRSTAAIGGLLLGWDALATSAAVAAPPGGPAVLVTDPSTVERLQQNGDVRAASRAFGQPDWSGVMSVPGAVHTYVLKHPQSPQVYTAVAADGSAGVSYRIGGANGSTAIEWMSPSAEPWATSKLSVDGSTVMTTPASAASSLRAANPDIPDVGKAFLTCFTNCMGACLTGSCVTSCGGCGLGQKVACAQCLVCAGSAGVSCAKNCK